MPIYVYRCKKCNTEIEEIQKFDDPPLVQCTEIGKDGVVPYRCDGELVKQVAQRGAFHFSGSAENIEEITSKIAKSQPSTIEKSFVIFH